MLIFFIFRSCRPSSGRQAPCRPSSGRQAPIFENFPIRQIFLKFLFLKNIKKKKRRAAASSASQQQPARALGPARDSSPQPRSGTGHTRASDQPLQQQTFFIFIFKKKFKNICRIEKFSKMGVCRPLMGDRVPVAHWMGDMT